MIASIVVITAGTRGLGGRRPAGSWRRTRASCARSDRDRNLRPWSSSHRSAIVARLIDDDGQSANSDRAEAIEGVVDKGSSADRAIGLLTRYPSARRRLPRPAAMMPPCRSGDADTSVIPGSSRDRRAGSPQDDRVAAADALSFGGPDILGRDPDEAHAHAPSALAVAAQGIADEHALSRAARKAARERRGRSPGRASRRRHDGCPP